MTHFICSSVFVCFGLLTADAEKNKGEPALTPPKGWQEKSLQGTKKAWVGTAADGFAPNINIMEGSFGGSLDKYVEASIETLKKMIPSYRQLRKESFTTTSGEKGVKLTTENQLGGRELRQTFYFFDGGSKKYVVTCTGLARDGKRLAPTFDEALKTFHFEK